MNTLLLSGALTRKGSDVPVGPKLDLIGSMGDSTFGSLIVSYQP